MTAAQTCDRCGERLGRSALAMGWPIPVTPPGGDPCADCEYIGPCCYGDDAHCDRCGGVLRAAEGAQCERRGCEVRP